MNHYLLKRVTIGYYLHVVIITSVHKLSLVVHNLYNIVHKLFTVVHNLHTIVHNLFIVVLNLYIVLQLIIVHKSCFC